MTMNLYDRTVGSHGGQRAHKNGHVRAQGKDRVGLKVNLLPRLRPNLPERPWLPVTPAEWEEASALHGGL